MICTNPRASHELFASQNSTYAISIAHKLFHVDLDDGKKPAKKPET
jgi:hypothetical protein